MDEQIEQENKEFSAQSKKKVRSREDKIGRLKYNQYLLKRVLIEIKEVREIQRIILNGLKGAGYFHFDVPLIQKYACEDQIDTEILQLVYQTGREGILPKEVAAGLPEYRLKHYNVTRRIQRMNKRLVHETGEKLFEKRGWKWAITNFGAEVWDSVERTEDSEVWKN